MFTIATAIIKGGTGKTATAASLAQAAAADGLKVLAIDLDPQANLTLTLKGSQSHKGAYHLINGEPLAECLQDTPQGITLAAASPDLSTLESKFKSANRLKQALTGAPFDTCIIDTPPAMGESVYNALQACNIVIYPVQTDTNSLQGLYHIADIVKRIRETNGDFQAAYTVITQYDGRAKLNQYLKSSIEAIAAETRAPVIATIRNGIALREAAAMQESLFTYAPKSRPAQDYKALWQQLIKHHVQTGAGNHEKQV